MIEVPNPNPGNNDVLTIYVYRPWNTDDVKRPSKAFLTLKKKKYSLWRT